MNLPGKVLPVDKDILLVLEQVYQVVHYKEHSLVLVGAQHDVGLLEVLCLHALLRSLIKERSICNH